MAWKAAGELATLLWFPEIHNVAQYRSDLKIAAANVLDIFATINPSKIITKIKYHLLMHIDNDTVQFGPLVGVTMEIYESFNAIFRCEDDAKWRRAGPGVRHFLEAHLVLQKLLGWSEGKPLTHACLLKSGASAAVKLVSLKRSEKDRVQYALKTTTAARALNYGHYSAESLWKKCHSVVSESLNECLVGSWVFAKSDMPEGKIKTGRISDILVNDEANAIVILELFQVLSTCDETFGMPVLVQRDSETTFMIIPTKYLMFKFNVQHFCHTAKCAATGERIWMQEQVASDNTEKYIEHNLIDRFIINSHAFHNAHLLRATLPRNLLAPIPLFEDWKSKHNELAGELHAKWESQHAKRKRTVMEGETDDETPAASKKPQKRQKRRVIKPTARVIAADLEPAEDDSETNDSELFEDSEDDDYSD
ncbi:hypothetical protein B0H10DRAFT_1939561 [Mycena sp. CBHHK59/15]|nr:hypothetical protein B0H10DRAFT_1939561 [Mycena sp. CBHHK59/15]